MSNMSNKILHIAESYKKMHIRKQWWYRTVAVMAAIVVFCTTYALILPAITLAKEPLCGLDEHTHGPECYEQQAPPGTMPCIEDLHEHEAGCLDSEGEIICGYADFVVHTHNELCKDEADELICSLPEVELHEHMDGCYPGGKPFEEEAHSHTEVCYTLERGNLICKQNPPTKAANATEETLTCTLQEAPPHVHTDACYQSVATDQLICTEPASELHLHEDGCYDNSGSLICTLEQTRGHQHTPDCYKSRQELTCQISPEGHTHQESCYTAAAEGHEHGNECYEWIGTLSCEASSAAQKAPKQKPVCGEKEAILHEHTPECYDETSKLICGKLETFEHIHTEDCFHMTEQDTVLICDLAEHTHDKRHCFVDEELIPEEKREEQEEDGGSEEETRAPPPEDPPQQCVSVIMSYDNSRDETRIILKAVSDAIPVDAYTWQWEASADGIQGWAPIPEATSILYRFPASEAQLSSHYRILGTRNEAQTPEFFAEEGIEAKDLPQRVISPRVSPLEDPAIVRHLTPTSPDDGNYYLYYYGFDRGGGRTVVHTGDGGLEPGMSAAPYEAFAAPQGYRWDGKWYLDESCTVPYDFDTPVSDMGSYLTGEHHRDLYLYPGGEAVWDITFVSYGSYVAPLQLLRTESFDIGAAQYIPTRSGYTFAGWYQDETLVLEATGRQTCPEKQTAVCYYAKWTPEYAPFDAVLRTENANDNGFGGAQSLGVWYAMTGSTITVETTGREPDYVHTVKCVLDGETYPVYTDPALTQEARLEDVYEDYFVFNNTTSRRWTEAFGFNRKPWSSDVIASGSNSTTIYFDYMRVAVDLTFRVDNEDGYFDIHKLVSDGLISGAVFDSGTAAQDGNVSASGVTAADAVQWSYVAASDGAQDNVYVLHHVKYGQRIADAFPTSDWITGRSENAGLLHWASLAAEDGRYGKTPLTQQTRLTALSQPLMAATGRAAAARTLQAAYPPEGAVRQAVIYAIECLPGETPDYTLRLEGRADGTMPTEIGFRVSTEESEVRYDTGAAPTFKELPGCTLLKNTGASLKINGNETLRLPASSTEKESQERNWWVSDVTVADLIGEYADCFGLPDDITKEEVQNLIGTDAGLKQVYVLHYTRVPHTVRFDFGYEDDGDSDHASVEYTGLQYGQSLSDYRNAMPDGTEHPLLNRTGYRFLGWTDEAGQLLTQEDWDRLYLTADSETLVFSAAWEEETGNVVQYYETQYTDEPFAWHFFRDGDTLPLPRMEEYPERWLWTNSQTGTQRTFSWDVPMYGTYGVAEELELNGQTKTCQVIRLYGDWQTSQVKVDYDANVPDGGIRENAPKDNTGYELSETRVPVKAMEDTTNTYGKRFAGWDLDRNGMNYQPGDYVEAEWMPTMTFTARWTEPEDAVKLVYDPNGGEPDTQTNSEYSYERGADTIVWDNTDTAEPEGDACYTMPGHLFVGWNTEADGSGEPHDPGTRLTLQQDTTTLYAQWRSATYTLYIQKYYEARADYSHVALPGAKFMLYDGETLIDGVQTTDEEGNLVFYSLNVGTRYTLVETDAPDGFVPLKQPLYFEVTAEGEFKIYDKYGLPVKYHEHVSGTFDGTDPTDQRVNMSIRNDAGYKLAATGGIGTSPYTLGGLLVVGAAVSLLMYNTLRKRRKDTTATTQREL